MRLNKDLLANPPLCISFFNTDVQTYFTSKTRHCVGKLLEIGCFDVKQDYVISQVNQSVVKHTDSTMSIPGCTIYTAVTDSVGEVVGVANMSGPPLQRQSGHTRLTTGPTNSYGYVSAA